ncbi:MAG: NTF2-like N-terminal transpeptidase domain-containing protein [Parabacteroides sp.]|nr:NTF2-like N-terminal transpeptidase domain-containing protein [Parabacteroides sp.]
MSRNIEKPDKLLVEYMAHIEKEEYESMYTMLTTKSKMEISQEEYVKRNSNIYTGMEVENIQINNMVVQENHGDKAVISYDVSFETIAGTVQLSNKAEWEKEDDKYRLKWTDSMILPELESTDQVRVSTSQAKRGTIQDRNGHILAGPGIATSVGIIPGKLEEVDSTLEKIAEILQIDKKTIEKKLSAEWVKDDSFVPIATITKVQELDLMSPVADEMVLKEKNRQDTLLAISGIMLSDIEVRSYNLGESAAHLIGYVQGVTAEDLEEHAGEGYSSNSVIGRSGMEGFFEKELKGRDGYDICIIDENGNEKDVVASVLREDGKNIQLTIDSELQKELYEQFKDVRGYSVAMNPYTGEVLALVSTPSYDNNDYIKGMSEELWTSLNEDENQPLYNRFRQVWCPGSTFKPVIAAIGLKTGKIDPNEDFGNEGLSWQKDESWGLIM